MANAKISWKVISVLKEKPSLAEDSYLFKLAENIGFYSQFGISKDFSYIPIVFKPNLQYHQKINGLLSSKLGIQNNDYGFPYKIFVPQINSTITFNISKIRLFPPCFLSLTIDLTDIPLNLQTSNLIEYQYLHKLYPLNQIIQWTIGMVQKMSGKDIDLHHSFTSKPAIRLDDVCPPGHLRKHLEDNISEYVGILIRNFDYNQMNKEISERVWEKNKLFSDKTSRKLLLLDKQGMLFLNESIPENTNIMFQPPDFSRAQDLFELAFVFDMFINNYLSLRQENVEFAESLLYKINTWVNAPEVIFGSFSYRNVWELLIEEFRLPSRADFLRKQVNIEKEDYLKSEYLEFTPSFTLFEANRVFNDIVREIGKSMIETNLKQIALDDLEQAKLAYSRKAYKASVIMLGAVLEALLLGTIRRPEVLEKVRTDVNCSRFIRSLGIDSSNLGDKIATKLRFEDYKNIIDCLIPDIEKLKVEGIQTFRNAVHPWKSVQEAHIYNRFDQTRALHHITSIKILAQHILTWSP